MCSGSLVFQVTLKGSGCSGKEELERGNTYTMVGIAIP